MFFIRWFWAPIWFPIAKEKLDRPGPGGVPPGPGRGNYSIFEGLQAPWDFH
jgi:hypothetical protein